MGIPTFVVPHYSDTEVSWDFLDATVTSLVEQSDPGWSAIVVDDASPAPDKRHRFAQLEARTDGRLRIVELDVRRGAGHARNVAVQLARKQDALFLMFLDADDLAHRDRVRATREAFGNNPQADFLYSSFQVIDEDGVVVPQETLTPSIQEILNSHAVDPVQGFNAWLRVVTETGYTTSSSTVSVTTELACSQPFPQAEVSEDFHTWQRMLASSSQVLYLDGTPGLRRIPSWVAGSRSRQRFGDDFYWMKLQLDADGFFRSLDIAISNGKIQPADRDEVVRLFYIRQAQCMKSEGRFGAYEICRALAAAAPGQPVEGAAGCGR